MSLKDVVDSAKEVVTAMTKGETRTDTELRQPVLDAIDHAAEQWSRRNGGEKNDWFSQEGETVALSPTLANGAPLTIDGQTTVFVPADRFADYLQAMKAAVLAGEFDAEIKGAAAGSQNVSGLAKVTMPGAQTDGSDDEHTSGKL